MKTKDIIISAMMLLAATTAQAQINIQGNVYGGARQADVGGHAYVNIGADHHDVIISAVYGGNDIAGTVGTGQKGAVPSEFTTKPNSSTPSEAETNGIDNTYDAFVSTNVEATGKHIFIGQIFGGGNGDYTYEDVNGNPLTDGTDSDGNTIYKVMDGSTKVATSLEPFVKPELNRTYLSLKGGTFGYAYGGGNNATVKDKNDSPGRCDIYINNTSAVWDINGADGDENTNAADDILSDVQLQAMGINTEFFDQNAHFHFSRVFGGNNKAAMAIQPRWHLNKGKIENLYSGGNEGAMTCETGLLLDINPSPNGTDEEKKQLKIENVFGGCRKADVDPRDKDGNRMVHVEQITGFEFPRDFAARVVVRGGDIKDVYGGNDVAGHVYFGNAIGIRCDIRGNVYGGGNGSYAYTDNPDLVEAFPLRYRDFYYDPIRLLKLPEGTTYDDITGLQSAQALNLFRPDAEQVSIRVMGTEAKKTIIGGSIYCGGNSATLKLDQAKMDDTEEYKGYPIVELKIGSYVVANEVFLGNNGANMVLRRKADGTPDQAIEDCVLYKYANYVAKTGSNAGKITTDTDGYDYSKMVLNNTTDTDPVTGRNQFEEYMDGCAMSLIPSVVFDKTYIPYSTYIGSLYCGGNVGSMTHEGLIPISFTDKVIIFEKVVGGCNNANVDAVTGYNAAYKGGLLRNPDPTTGNKLELTFNGLKIQPKRWTSKTPTPEDLINITLPNGTVTSYPLEWNTVTFDEENNKYVNDEPITTGTYEEDHELEANKDDLERRLSGGNIYGGCYNTGHVEGNVVINLNATIVDRNILFDEVVTDALGEQSLYGSDLLTQETYKIKKRHTGVILGQQGMDVLGKALNVFGGGYGAGSEIWGSTTINLNRGYTFQVFGGGEAGAIGKDEGSGYTYDARYSCFINLRGENDGVSKQEDQSEYMAECEFIYGGGFFGTIAGNTVINLGKGRVFNTFGGSCNADILGHTETYIGRQIKKITQTITDSETGEEVELVTKDYAMDMLKHYNVGDKFQAATDFYEDGFPYIRDMVYGGNDLGGKILGEESSEASQADCNFKYRVNPSALGLVHNPGKKADPDVLKASAYVEYTQGRADAIFGGCFGTYDYTDPHYSDFFNANGTPKTGYSKPRMNNAFVNFRPIAGVTSKYNWVKTVYGAGQGYPSMLERDELQNRSYVLVDIQIPSEESTDEQKNMKIFGAGAWAGVGMSSEINLGAEPDYDKASAIIDLVKGEVGYACGASYKEGFTRRTVVNVPGGITVGEGEEATTLNSTINIQKIFGGGEGFVDTKKDYKGNVIKDEDTGEPIPWPRNDVPCDAYEANVNFSSPEAIVRSAIYGGNNACRRTLYGKVNINAPVHNGVVDNKKNLMTATVYGAGCGEDTWSEYTEVNLNPRAEVFEVYGGGEKGRVINKSSRSEWKDEYDDAAKTEYNALLAAWEADPNNDNIEKPKKITMDLTMGAVCVDNGLNNALVTPNIDGSKHNTNVHIKAGATVNSYYVWKTPSDGDAYETWEGGYAYGGGLGKSGIDNSGDVYGTTYIDLQGGTVKKDIYGAGTQGSVMDKYGVGDFIASSNVFVKGGTARNVYGGGWAGSVGRHAGVPRVEPVLDEDGEPVLDEDENPKTQTVMDYLDASCDDDLPGETYVVIGTLNGRTFTDGIPAIERNAYGGGEGGAVWGTTHIKLNNGFIGYRHFDDEDDVEDPDCEVVSVAEAGWYQAKLHDETWYGDQTNRLKDSGCLFGGGYIDNSSVDNTRVVMYGGTVRNSLFGGGEIAAIGRGKVHGIEKERTLVGIYKAGKTNVELYDGKVKRNVFGGGRGYNNLGENGKLYSDGYVFGQTEVRIHGGEIGTEEGVARGEGNVFGGGDVGYVYSAYEDADGHLAVGKKSGIRYNDDKEGYYYKYERLENQEISYDPDDEEFKGGSFVLDDPEKEDDYQLTEDCKVLIEPQCKVTQTSLSISVSYAKDETVSADDLSYLQAKGETSVLSNIDGNGKVTAVGGITFNREYTIDDKYDVGSYVPIDYLNTLGNKDDPMWRLLQIAERDDEGIIIHNAVFAGGNVTSGSDKLYANATTVFGNATASIYDVYNRDLITIGTGHTGGLYGDGNLTFVDGYRGLNITNYGTDYYSIAREIDQTTYDDLPKREQAYYELRYKYIGNDPVRDNAEKEYHKEERDAQGNITKSASVITLDEFLAVFEGKWDMFDETRKLPNPTYWEQNGVCSRYMGRIMNTIQRADFCGVFGSRMVMQGAHDRVPSTVDTKNYTINRVREVSLNKKPYDKDDANSVFHGNYFGIYNVVNNLGNLTSDLDFSETRTTDADTQKNPEYTTSGGESFYQWKADNHDNRTRNNGKSHNEVALASGVYLEIKDLDILEKKQGAKDGDEWGYITGVVELDLLNVQPGIGGGFVYAKNEHRVLLEHKDNKYATLTALNADAVTRKDYTYKPDVDANKVEWETSGNFVHSTQIIIDDCYPKSKKYLLPDPEPVHYWFIKGEVYVYDQYITAYTGAANAYNETVDIPLTITAASNGVIKLLNVQPNLYAYYSSYTGSVESGSGVKLGSTDELEINNVKYKLNDPISYWDWYMLSEAEKKLFKPKTYVTIEPCMIGDVFYPEGYVMLPVEYEQLKTLVGSMPADGTTYQYIYKGFNSIQSWGDNDNNPAQWSVQASSSKYYGPDEENLWYDEPGSTYKYKYVSVRNSTDNGNTWSKYSTPSLLPVVYKATKDGNNPAEVVTDNNGNPILRSFDYVFRESNNMSHETGYILTYKVDNPLEWDTWYTEYSDAANTSTPREKKQKDKEGVLDLNPETATVDGQTKKLGPNDGPTYRYVGTDTQGNPLPGELLGQREYEQGNLISKDVYMTYQAAADNYPRAVPDNQAVFHQAYLMKAEVDEVYKKVYEDGGFISTKVNLYEGAAVAEQEYSASDWAKISPYTEAAYVSTKTIKLSEKEYIPLNKKMGQKELDGYLASNKYTAEQKAEIQESVVPAYYCTQDGMYGGDYYAAGTNYRGLAAWSSMSKEDRDKFAFNYDAFDLLIDSNYGGTEGAKYQYDGVGLTTETQVRNTNPAGYSVPQPIDYQATYNGGTSTIILPDDAGSGFVYYEADYTASTPDKKHTILVDDVLERNEYEALPNEQRYYSPITIVKDDEGNNIYDYYVAHEEFFTADANYPVGSVITYDVYSGLLSDQKSKMTHLKFNTTLSEGTTFYYCRQDYIAGQKGGDYDAVAGKVIVVEPASATTTDITMGYNPKTISDNKVPAGLIIGSTAYASLPNKQKDFSIHGKSPVETSSLFVSRKSDIYDLSKERIITVVYQYDYDESDVTKTHITPIRERHVVNIHILFESGIPEVEDISAPKIVIPGTGITMMEPFVTPGAYEVTGGGWELFETKSDVESHTNGIEYKPGDPLYWYQDGFYLTYYAETYLGKTYSNEVPVSVANYHDLKSVMDAVKHHYYIDKPNVHRDPKIYIKDYSGSNENGLDILKNLFDLSVLDKTKVNTDEKGLITTQKVTGTPDSPFKGHALLNSQVKAARNLEFFLHSNIDHTGSPWTPIGNDNETDDPETTNVVEGECFQGKLHGDGYYIKGLDKSLFAHLCGQVYNLGVDGSFRGAGVAEEGSGYVENCWIRTSAPNAADDPDAENPLLTGVGHYPVFANPSRTGTADLVQVVNCYYPESNKYTVPSSSGSPAPADRGKATQMPDKSFYNGEVAYNLNGFYLKKRYYDQTPTTGKPYYFFKDVDGTLTLTQNPSNYPASYAFYPIDEDNSEKKVRGYVEERFFDGDFIYASGKIPDEENQRLYVPPTSTSSTTQTAPQGYYPIWPDDYIFFGQRLNYDYVTAETVEDLALKKHQEVPSHIVKKDDRVLLSNYIDSNDPMNSLYGNRVYRAPAYFRNSKMNVAYFNPNAVFAQTKKGDATIIAYKDMTAIDFTGGNDDVSSGYQPEFVKTAPYDNEKMPNGAFYPPLLDDGGLTSFKNEDLTKNLLVYTGTASPAVTATNDVVAAYLPDRSYKPNSDNGHPEYKAAVPWDRYSDKEKIYGHRVMWNGSAYVAQNDHFLVDKEDFDAPIGYSFASGKRMWYQRDPENYVGKKTGENTYIDNHSGWEGISLPFTADIVTTDFKGEITHFYGSSSSVSESGTKRGHEYWLREFKDGGEMNENKTEYVANFGYPTEDHDKVGVKGDKNYTNTFLWDYYYQYNYSRDANEDKYQEDEENEAYTYYKKARTHKDYLRLANGIPYIIGFPGERYFEFDLSGNFSPENTLRWGVDRDDAVKAQHIIFSSKPGATTIAVSDSEKSGVSYSVTDAGKTTTYTFKPSYLNEALKAGTDNYVLKADGSRYDKVPAASDDEDNPVPDTEVSAFRPYFTSVTTTSGARPVTRSIVFGNDDSQLKGVEEKGDPSSEDPGLLRIYAKKHKIVVESALTRDIDIRIVNPAGITMTTFTIEPGETIETRINNAGVYIVQSSDNRYTKKLVVR